MINIATVSGALKFDSARTGTFSATLPGIANVPIVLQNTATNVMLAVYTDANGNFTFNNVPNGNYRIVEAYGTPAVASPGDFSAAVAGSPAIAVVPPISYVNNPPAGATNLDCITRNTLLVTVSGANLTGENILNGPVRYTSITNILDSNVIVSPINLINVADAGTFGVFPPGTVSNTGASPNPYPDIGTDFIYVLPNPAVVTPNDGQYTIQNIMNNSHSNSAGTWWRIADHTTGNETGRMMVINGSTPGAVIFRDAVPVSPNTYYLFSAWILNLGKQVNLANPQLGVQIFDSGGNILYSATLGTLIPINVNEPEWKQIGTVINSLANTSLTVQFVSMGPAATGNDYAIDDIVFNEIAVPVLIPTKTVSSNEINVGDTVTYTVTLQNTNYDPLTNLMFQDLIPAGLSFVPGTVMINGINDPAANPNSGFAVPDVPGGGTLTVRFAAVASSVPPVNPTVNSAQISYYYSPVIGGIASIFNTVSNDVTVRIISADLAVAKTVDKNPAFAGDTLTYTITVTNNGPDTAASPLLTDNLPSDLKNPTFSTDGGATWTPWTGSLTLPPLVPGQSKQVLIMGIINYFATGVFTNSTSVNSPTADPDPANNTAAVNIAIEASADLSVVKTSSPGQVTAGNLLTYTLVISNAGPSDALNTTLTDVIPPELTGVQFSTDGGATWQPWNSPYNIGLMAHASVITILIRGTVKADVLNNINNTVTVSSSTPDPDLANNTFTTITPVNELADLAITKSGSPSLVHPGDTLTYTITAVNNGPSDAQNVQIADTLPPMITGAQYSLDAGVTWQSWTGSYTIGVLPDGYSFTLLMRGTVAPTASGIITNTAVVSSSTADPDPTNNSAVAITPIGTAADLAVSISGSPAPVNPGQLLTYTIVAENLGPDEALNTVLTDLLPAALTGAEFSTDGGVTWQPWTGAYTIGDLSAGSAESFLVRGTVSPTATGLITNTVTVHSDTPDPNPGNNSASEITPIGTSADLAIIKSGDANPVQGGSQLTYTLVAMNFGPDDAQNVVITDILPFDLSGAQYSRDDGVTWQPWTGSYQIGTLMNGDSVTLLIRATVRSSATGALTNTAVLNSNTPDPNPNNNSATLVTAVESSADLAIAKSGVPNPAIAGNTLTYTLAVTNNGPSDAQGAVLIDAMPTGILNPEFSTNGGSNWQSWSSPYPIGTIVSGDSINVLIRGDISPAARGIISNTAVVTSTTSDPNLANNSNTSVTPVEAGADLAITKTANPSPVTVGAPLSYTVTVTNFGPSYAQDVLLTDVVPPSLSNGQYSTDSGLTWNTWNGNQAIGTLASGASVTVLLRGTVNSSVTGSITNTAFVSSITPDPNMLNNSVIVNTPVDAGADLAIVKTASPNPVSAGDILTYGLQIFNAGPADAQNVMITDQTPIDLTRVQFSNNGGVTWHHWTGSYTLDTLANGDSFTLLLRGVVNTLATGVLSNTAAVSSATTDPNPANNSSMAITTVEALADLAITKFANPNPAQAGHMLTYTIVATNNGPSNAQNVQILDILLAAIPDAQYSADGGLTWQPWTGSYTIGDLANRAAFTLLIQGTVDPSATGNLVNTTTVSSTTLDPDITNNSDIEITPIVEASADIAVVKTAVPNPGVPGESLTYTITVSNNGPDAAQDVVLTDTVSSVLVNPQVSADGGITWTPWVNPYVLGTLPAGGRQLILIRGILSTSTANVMNTAAVFSSTPDPDLTNNSSGALVPIGNVADLALVKVACPNPVAPCGTVTYTIGVSNGGPGEATGVVLTDTLPDAICRPQYSLNGSQNWLPWSGSLSLGNLSAGSNATVLIRGVV
ncbi:MAG: hypothetical protein FWC60_10240, partial [Firmicutes bacterium]|nr:hypothetical protein [Bacillota bacterium]